MKSEPLTKHDIDHQFSQLKGWSIVKKHLVKEFKFKDFKKALVFVNDVGRISEKISHHPDIYLSYGLVRIKIQTHSLKGLSINDFHLASKIDQIK